MIIQSRVIKYGDNINTDLIIAGKYTKTLNMQDLVEHVMEDLDPKFTEKIKTAKVVIAGKNFGCGSSREQAPLALKHAGVECVIAKSFARIFYRNAINIGLILVEADTSFIEDGHIVRYVVGSNLLENLTTGETTEVKEMPKVMVRILQEGGLVNYLQKYGSLWLN